jgi:hypothetical protein
MQVMVMVFRHVGWQAGHGPDQVTKLLGERLSAWELARLRPDAHGEVPNSFQNLTRLGRIVYGPRVTNRSSLFVLDAKIAAPIGMNIQA